MFKSLRSTTRVRNDRLYSHYQNILRELQPAANSLTGKTLLQRYTSDLQTLSKNNEMDVSELRNLSARHRESLGLANSTANLFQGEAELLGKLLDDSSATNSFQIAQETAVKVKQLLPDGPNIVITDSSIVTTAIQTSTQISEVLYGLLVKAIESVTLKTKGIDPPPIHLIVAETIVSQGAV